MNKVDVAQLMASLHIENSHLLYAGPFSYNLINELGYHIKNYLTPQKQVRDKVFYVFVELCENVCRYSAVSQQVAGKQIGLGAVCISEADKYFVVQTINPVEEAERQLLEARTRELLQLSRRQLRQLKSKLRQQAVEQKHPGGNIGLVEVALRLNKQLKFDWIDLSGQLVLFRVKAYIHKQEQGSMRMEDLIIKGDKGTYLTPDVYFSAETGVCEIQGESYQEDTFEFYNTLIHWLETYIQEIKKPIVLNLRLTYFNTSSSRALQEIFLLLKDYQAQGGQVTINWYYQVHDESMLEEAEDFQLSTGMQFNIISVDEGEE